MPLVGVRPPVRPHVSAAMSTACADHTRAERADRQVIRQVVRIHDAAVVAIDGIAIDQQVPAAVRADMAQGYGLELLVLRFCTQLRPGYHS